MTMDKSLRFQVGLVRARSVLTRGERIAKLKETDRWADGRSPLGLPKVRVQKLAMKKKKKAKEEAAEGETAAAGAPGAAPAAAPAAGGKAPAAGAKAPAATAKAPAKGGKK
ncbi:MAG: small basic protein [Planctomycetia bacterium]|nr:small basic protein [Planctomycetia bacterium]